VLGAVGFLYFQPITTYLETRQQLADRRSEVATLRAERPDEHLFIVKGTAAWSRKHSG
jgi:hypothetical protein